MENNSKENFADAILVLCLIIPTLLVILILPICPQIGGVPDCSPPSLRPIAEVIYGYMLFAAFGGFLYFPLMCYFFAQSAKPKYQRYKLRVNMTGPQSYRKWIAILSGLILLGVISMLLAAAAFG